MSGVAYPWQSRVVLGCRAAAVIWYGTSFARSWAWRPDVAFPCALGHDVGHLTSTSSTHCSPAQRSAGPCGSLARHGEQTGGDRQRTTGPTPTAFTNWLPMLRRAPLPATSALLRVRPRGAIRAAAATASSGPRRRPPTREDAVEALLRRTATAKHQRRRCCITSSWKGALLAKRRPGDDRRSTSVAAAGGSLCGASGSSGAPRGRSWMRSAMCHPRGAGAATRHTPRGTAIADHEPLPPADEIAVALNREHFTLCHLTHLLM